MDAIERYRIRRQMRLDARGLKMDGGKGSGNWGHKGRPGERGGSGKGGGVQNRGAKDDDGNYGSDAKENTRRKSFAKPHRFSGNELKDIKKLAKKDEQPVRIYIKGMEKGQYVSVEPDGTASIRDANGRRLGDGQTALMFASFNGKESRVIYPMRDTRINLTNGRKGGAFSDNAYSDSRKGKAGRIKTDDTDSSDFAKHNGVEKLSDAERKGIKAWTSDLYQPMGRMLRSGEWQEEHADEPITEEVQKKYADSIDDTTAALSKCKTDRDMYFQRSVGSLRSMFARSGVSMWLPTMGKDGYSDATVEEANRVFTGAVGLDEAFMSCDTANLNEAGFMGRNVIMEIYAPKGTEAAYVGSNSMNPHERETILQRGTAYRCTGVTKNPKNGGLIVHAEIIGQYPRERTGNTFGGKRRGTNA